MNTAMHAIGESTTADQITISTMRFGAVEAVQVATASLYTFPEALPGLPESHRYALIADAAYAPMRWLQSLDEAAVCLPVLGLAALTLPGYAAQVSRATGVPEAALVDRALLVTRYDPSAHGFITNLLAPIVLDPAIGTGRQIVLEGQSHPLRQPIQWQPDTRTFSLPC